MANSPSLSTHQLPIFFFFLVMEPHKVSSPLVLPILQILPLFRYCFWKIPMSQQIFWHLDSYSFPTLPLRSWILQDNLLPSLRQTSMISNYILNLILLLTDKCSYHHLRKQLIFTASRDHHRKLHLDKMHNPSGYSCIIIPEIICLLSSF